MPDTLSLIASQTGRDHRQCVREDLHRSHTNATTSLKTGRRSTKYRQDNEGDQNHRLARAFTLGAISYLLKTARSDEIVRAIRNAIVGRHSVAPEVAKQVARHTGDGAFTDREIAVLHCVAEGRSNSQIAETRHIAEDTVKARMKSILGKLGVEDRTHAVMIAITCGFIDSAE